MPILRGAPYVAESVLVGEPDPSAGPLRIAMPPPPPPPPVPLAEPAPFETTGRDTWSPPWAAHAAPPEEPVEPEPHPLEAVVQEKLVAAERLLSEADVAAEQVLADARRQAAEMAEVAEAELKRAREEVEQMKTAAEAEVEKLRDEARSAGHLAGYDAGHAEGLAKAEAEMADKVGYVTRLAVSAAVDRRELLHSAEAEVVRLATRIARKVLQRELELDRAIINRMAEVALRHVAADGLVKLRVNPADVAELSNYWERAHGAAEGDRAYEVVADPEVARGGIVIETRAGTIDAQIETQLDEIAEALGVEDAGEGDAGVPSPGGRGSG